MKPKPDTDRDALELLRAKALARVTARHRLAAARVRASQIVVRALNCAETPETLAARPLSEEDEDV